MKIINLPPVVDRTAAIELATELSDAMGAGTEVAVAAGNVRQIGQCGLQLLVSAALTAEKRDLSFMVQDRSEPFENALRIAGLHRLLPGPAAQAL
ncbi:MAG: STAS domain-containing protein [Alphaproteobacteria bacterium]|nr:STAS domain-containing protein [Alphaproteobacteria bacterium]